MNFNKLEVVGDEEEIFQRERTYFLQFSFAFFLYYGLQVFYIKRKFCKMLHSTTFPTSYTLPTYTYSSFPLCYNIVFLFLFYFYFFAGYMYKQEENVT